VVETPDPEIPEPEDPTPLTEEPEPESEELTTETPETSPPPEEAPAEEETPAADPEPEEVETSGEDINVRMEGLRRDYPAYYGNIIRQMDRCFRWRQGGRWEAVVTFVIRSDGTISDLDLVQGSGNMAFDTQALGAVECAGQGRLGPLPDELPYDQLPVQFRFSPPN
jgi:TonB family protein